VDAPEKPQRRIINVLLAATGSNWRSCWNFVHRDQGDDAAKDIVAAEVEFDTGGAVGQMQISKWASPHCQKHRRLGQAIMRWLAHWNRHATSIPLTELCNHEAEIPSRMYNLCRHKNSSHST
jgi:hypothetical protein